MSTADKSTPIDAVELIFVVFRLLLVVGATAPGEIKRIYPLLERLTVIGVNARGLVLVCMNKFVSNRLFGSIEPSSIVGLLRDANRAVTVSI